MGISGVGGYGYQDPDWLKHNAVLKDLIARPWPVEYQLGKGYLPLVYYIAFYLPAAFFGKLWGWMMANQVIFGWGFIGLFLAMLWFHVLNQRATSTVVLLFVFFSGLDVIGEWIISPIIDPIVAYINPKVGSILSWEHIEFWAYGWQYSSNATLLFWVPHQALAGWIVSGILIFVILSSTQKKYRLFYCALSALWSPFVTIGLLPYLLVDFLLERDSLSTRLKQYISLPNLCGFALLIVVGLFFSSKLYESASLSTAEIPHGFSLSFIEDPNLRFFGFVLILVFSLLEFGLYGLLIYSSSPKWNVREKVLFATTLICLSLFPFYVYGELNDFVMRASIPALFVLSVFLSRALHEKSLTTPKHVILIMLVILGSATAMIEFYRHAENILDIGTILQTPRMDQVSGVWNYSQQLSDSISLQYFGSSESPFFEFMAKMPRSLP
jgi:hypothetical protein